MLKDKNNFPIAQGEVSGPESGLEGSERAGSRRRSLQPRSERAGPGVDVLPEDGVGAERSHQTPRQLQGRKHMQGNPEVEGGRQLRAQDTRFAPEAPDQRPADDGECARRRRRGQQGIGGRRGTFNSRSGAEDQERIKVFG